MKSSGCDFIPAFVSAGEMGTPPLLSQGVWWPPFPGCALWRHSQICNNDVGLRHFDSFRKENSSFRYRLLCFLLVLHSLRLLRLFLEEGYPKPTLAHTHRSERKRTQNSTNTNIVREGDTKTQTDTYKKAEIQWEKERQTETERGRQTQRERERACQLVTVGDSGLCWCAHTWDVFLALINSLLCWSALKDSSATILRPRADSLRFIGF